MQERVNVVITVEADDGLVARLRARFPQVHIDLHPAHTAAEIPPDVWAEVEVLFTWQVLPDQEMAPNLCWVQAASAGVDSLLAHPLFESGEVALTNTSGIHAVTMAEHAMAMVLALARRIPTLLALQAARDWPPDRYEVLAPRPLRDSTLGIVGYGSIGRELARLAQAFGMAVLATKRDAMRPARQPGYALPGTGDPDGVMVNRLYPPQALKSMLQECNFVVVLVPKTAETVGLLDAQAMAAMKPGAHLINMARGGLVDEDALLKALQSGALAGAAFDVFETEPLPPDSPLWAAPNLIISPHIAGYMPDYLDRAAEVFAENLDLYLQRRPLINVVDRERGY